MRHIDMAVVVVRQCEREIAKLPMQVRESLVDLVMLLEAGVKLSLPTSRPMPSVAPGVHELRIKDRSGVYRVFYALQIKGNTYVLHAFKKTTSKTPQKNIDLVIKRLKTLKREIGL